MTAPSTLSSGAVSEEVAGAAAAGAAAGEVAAAAVGAGEDVLAAGAFPVTTPRTELTIGPTTGSEATAEVTLESNGAEEPAAGLEEAGAVLGAEAGAAPEDPLVAVPTTDVATEPTTGRDSTALVTVETGEDGEDEEVEDCAGAGPDCPEPAADD